MSITEAKQTLPEVKIKIGRKVYTGQTYGRKLAFAQVHVKELNVSYEYAWSTIARAVTEDRTLKI